MAALWGRVKKKKGSCDGKLLCNKWKQKEELREKSKPSETSSPVTAWSRQIFGFTKLEKRPEAMWQAVSDRVNWPLKHFHHSSPACWGRHLTWPPASTATRNQKHKREIRKESFKKGQWFKKQKRSRKHYLFHCQGIWKKTTRLPPYTQCTNTHTEIRSD